MKRRRKAIARIEGENGIRGRVRFLPREEGTLIIAEISGLPESQSGFYGFHIHEGDSCGGKDYAETGGHFNPEKTVHPRHAGDLPPLLANGDKAWLAVITGRFAAEDVIGRTVVIHAEPDDFRSQPAGNAGKKIACGVIRGSSGKKQKNVDISPMECYTLERN